MNKPPRLEQVTVIIVAFNSAHCLPALASTLVTIPNVIVVDNGSRDDTVAQVRQRLPQARIIENKVNRGFGAANNVALGEVSTPYALLLNPDCLLTPDNLLRLLRHVNDDPQVAMVAPQLVNQRGDQDINYRWPHHLWKSKTPGATGPCCVGFACGACLLLNMAVMRPVGFFDERFFLYYEDDDLCTRLFERQLPMVLLPEAVAVHTSRGSVGGAARWRSEYWRGYHHAQSKIRYTHKHGNEAAARRQVWRVMAGAVFILPLRILIFSPKLIARMWGRIVGLWQLKL